MFSKRKKIRKNYKSDKNFARKMIYKMKSKNLPIDLIAESVGKSVHYIRNALSD